MKSIKNNVFPAFLAAMVLAALAGAAFPASVAEAQTGGNMYISISDNAYSNPFVTLPLGVTVTWTNTGINQHSVTANDGSFDSGTLSHNQSFTRTFSTAGTYHYYDRFYGSQNSGMRATLVVGDVNTTYLVCSPSSQFVNAGGTATLTATGGNGIFNWYAPNATPSSGSGSTFTATFYGSGPQTVNVTSNNSTAQCTVNVGGGTVNPPIGGAPACSPSVQNALAGAPVTFTATGGNGSYVWSSPGLVIANPTGSSFTATFNGSGTRSVTVSSNGQASVCTVNVTGSVLGVSDVSTGPEDAALWALAVGLLGAMASTLVISRKRLV